MVKSGKQKRRWASTCTDLNTLARTTIQVDATWFTFGFTPSTIRSQLSWIAVLSNHLVPSHQHPSRRLLWKQQLLISCVRYVWPPPPLLLWGLRAPRGKGGKGRGNGPHISQHHVVAAASRSLHKVAPSLATLLSLHTTRRVWQGPTQKNSKPLKPRLQVFLIAMLRHMRMMRIRPSSMPAHHWCWVPHALTKAVKGIDRWSHDNARSPLRELSTARNVDLSIPHLYSHFHTCTAISTLVGRHLRPYWLKTFHLHNTESKH